MVIGLLITVGMWWTYFEGFAARAEERLREHDDPVLAAADGYSYLHLVIVAGIITFAVAVTALLSALCAVETESVRRVLSKDGREASAVR